MSCKMSVAVEMKYIYIVKYTMFCFENKILFDELPWFLLHDSRTV